MPSVARKAEKIEIARLAKRMAWTWTIVRRTSPLRESKDVISESSVVGLVDKDAMESGGLVVGIGLELGVELDDECGGDCK